MAFGKLKVKARCINGRGSVDASAVIDAVKNSWSDLQDAIAGLDEAEQVELRNHFNDCIEGETDLGDILFGSADDFESRLKFLDDEVCEEYTEELMAQEVIDKAELEASVAKV